MALLGWPASAAADAVGDLRNRACMDERVDGGHDTSCGIGWRCERTINLNRPAISRYSSVDSIGEDRCFDSPANVRAAPARTWRA